MLASPRRARTTIWASRDTQSASRTLWRPAQAVIWTARKGRALGHMSDHIKASPWGGLTSAITLITIAFESFGEY